MDWTNLSEVKDTSGKIFEQVLTITNSSFNHFLLVPCRDTDNARHTAELFLHEVTRYRGLLSSIVSDRDTKFTCQFWKALCQMMEVRYRLTSPFHPHTNGRAERTNQTMKQVLRTMAMQQQRSGQQPINWLRLNRLRRNRHKQRSFGGYGSKPILHQLGLPPHLLL